MDRRAWVGLSVVLAVGLAACDSGAPGAKGPAAPSTYITVPDPTFPTGPLTAEGCIDGTVLQFAATQGVISAGPLAPNRPYWRQPQGTKFWVASQRDQPPSPAYFEARRLDAAAEPVLVERPLNLPAPVPSLRPFYPGSLRIPQAGLWQITVRIGPDSACFVVQVD
ncbi:MAG: hypothetical protein L0Y54_08625 [Sporichthyaceae bacterium]|nr:hypothetical protein [Sporichthyaceae bacterium]